MARLLERGLRRHAVNLPAAAAIPVTIIVMPENQSIDAIDAVPGRRDIAQFNVGEYVGTAEIFDWIVVEQDLVLEGHKKEPAEGWEIWHRLDDGRTAVYVARPATGTRVFDVLDQLGLMYRIHTKLERIEPAV